MGSMQTGRSERRADARHGRLDVVGVDSGLVPASTFERHVRQVYGSRYDGVRLRIIRPGGRPLNDVQLRLRCGTDMAILPSAPLALGSTSVWFGSARLGLGPSAAAQRAVHILPYGGSN